MMVDAIVVNRSNKVQVFAPKLSKGKPIHTLSLEHKNKKVKLVSSMSDIENDKSNCKCESMICNNNKYSRYYLRTSTIPRNSCINCFCDNTIYIRVPEILLK